MMLLGIGLAIFSGFCLGIFLAPLRFLDGWEWEHVWVVWSVVAMLVGPVAVGLGAIPHIVEVYGQAGGKVLLVTLIIGAIAGTSGFLYSLSIPAIGLGLATAVNNGSSIATSLLPLAMVHPQAVVHWSGRLTIIGVAVTIGGIVLCEQGGSLREKNPAQSIPASVGLKRRLCFARAVAFCLLSGIIASGMNLGLAFPTRLAAIANKFGSSKFGAAFAFLTPYLVGGFFSNFLYAWVCLRRNRSVTRFWSAKAPRCAIWTVLMGAMFVLGVVCYAASVAMLRSFGAIIAWGVFGAASILTASLWDVAQKEWSGQAGKVMFFGVASLLLAILILSVAQYLYQREAGV